MSDKNEIRRRLMERMSMLKARVGRIESDMQQPLDDDLAEQAVEREDDEALDALEGTTLEEIAETRRALQRLDAGTYGKCASCGGGISAERLEAVPTATRCIDCATAGASSGH